VPGVNKFASYGRWAFAEFIDIYEIQAAFAKLIELACPETIVA
jgi:type III restriction enzyme